MYNKKIYLNKIFNKNSIDQTNLISNEFQNFQIFKIKKISLKRPQQ